MIRSADEYGARPACYRGEGRGCAIAQCVLLFFCAGEVLRKSFLPMNPFLKRAGGEVGQRGGYVLQSGGPGAPSSLGVSPREHRKAGQNARVTVSSFFGPHFLQNGSEMVPDRLLQPLWAQARCICIYP